MGEGNPLPCGRNFKGVSEGKHHCRLCGKIFCDGCSRHRVTLPSTADIYRYMDGHSAAAAAGASVADAGAEAAGQQLQLRACEQCLHNCHRYVLLPIAVKKSIELVEASPLCRLYHTASELKANFTNMLAASETGDAAMWDEASDTLRQQLQRSRDILDLVGKMSKQPQHSAQAPLLRSMEMYFAASLREDLLPRFKRLQTKFDGARASAEEIRQQQQQAQQQQQDDDDDQLDGASPHVQVADAAAEGSAAADAIDQPPSSCKEASDSVASATAQTAAAAAPKPKPTPNPSKADLTSLFNIFKFSRPSARAPPAQQKYGGRVAGSFNTKNLQGRSVMDSEDGGRNGGGCDAKMPERLESGDFQSRADGFEGGGSLEAKIPEHLELGVLKRYADGFEAFLGSEGQFTAEEFVQWCGCDECASPLEDASNALAVGAAIAGQNFFEMVEGGSRLKIFDDKSDAVWYFTGKWAGTPVQWTPAPSTSAKLDEVRSLSPDLYPVATPALSSPTRRIQSMLASDPSPAKSTVSLDVIDDVSRPEHSPSCVARHTSCRMALPAPQGVAATTFSC